MSRKSYVASDEIALVQSGVSVSSILLDRSGTILEMSDPWKARSQKWTTRPDVDVGKSYFDYCIRPDEHSIEIIRGLKQLLTGQIDVFSTIYWQERPQGCEWFLIVASSRPSMPATAIVVHIDISTILQGRSQPSALMVGLGAAASAQIDASITSTVRRAIAETLSRNAGNNLGRPSPSSLEERKQMDRLSKCQVEMLAYLAKGLTNQQIARARKMSVNTVKAQVATIIQKLEVKNRTQAALFAMKSDTHAQQ
jgi:DNA-binding NarL/FixJ family response regulator